MKIFKKAEELIFPSSLYCICCGNYIDDTRTYGLCDHCMDHMNWNEDPPMIIRGMKFIKCMDYGIYGRSIVFSLKYGGQKYIAGSIAEIMRDKLNLEGETGQVLVPVPMNPEKQRKRGFNHAQLITEKLSYEMGIEEAECLVRTRDTLPMKGLSADERRENIRGSIDFDRRYDKMIEDRKVILVDDFFTTGSTAFECASALEKGNPSEIIFLAFASGRTDEKR